MTDSKFYMHNHEPTISRFTRGYSLSMRPLHGRKVECSCGEFEHRVNEADTVKAHGCWVSHIIALLRDYHWHRLSRSRHGFVCEFIKANGDRCDRKANWSARVELHGSGTVFCTGHAKMVGLPKGWG